MIDIARDDIATPYEAMRLYRVMTMHFSESAKYDAIRYSFGGMHLKEETYRNARHRYLFEKIAKTHGRKRNVIGYYTANIINDQRWIASMSDNTETLWRGRVQSINYSFKSAIRKASEHIESFDLLLSDSVIFSESIFTIEHLALLHDITGFCDRINKHDPLGIYASKKYMIRAYTPLIRSHFNKKSAIHEIKASYTH